VYLITTQLQHAYGDAPNTDPISQHFSPTA